MNGPDDGYVESFYLSNEGVPLELGDFGIVLDGSSNKRGIITRYKSGDWVRLETDEGETTVPADWVTILRRPPQDLEHALISAEMAIHRAKTLMNAVLPLSADEGFRAALEAVDEGIHGLRAAVEAAT